MKSLARSPSGVKTAGRRPSGGTVTYRATSSLSRRVNRPYRRPTTPAQAEALQRQKERRIAEREYHRAAKLEPVARKAARAFWLAQLVALRDVRPAPGAPAAASKEVA